MEAGSQEFIDAFLQMVRSTTNKQQFMSKVHDFDVRFTDQASQPTISERQKSVEKLPPLPQQKIKNPFKTSIQQTYKGQPRQNNFLPPQSNIQNYNTVASMQIGQQNQVLNPRNNMYNMMPNQSRSEQNFYKVPSNQNIFNGMQPSSFNQHPMHNQNNQNSQLNYPSQNANNIHASSNIHGTSNINAMNNINSINAHNYQANNQRQYDELKEQFFKPTNRPELYSKISSESQNNMASSWQNEPIYNYNQMGMNMLPQGTYNQAYHQDMAVHKNYTKDTPINYVDSGRRNPFSKQ